MKKLLLLLAFSIALGSAKAQGVSYQGEVDLGYAFGVGWNPVGRVQVHLVNGVRLNDYLFTGIGVGLEYYCEGSYFLMDPTYMLPIYANVKGYLPVSKKIAPYLGVDVGYSIGLGDKSRDNGFMVTPALGVRFAIKQSAINVSVGYAYQRYSERYGCSYGPANAISLKVGFEF